VCRVVYASGVLVEALSFSYVVVVILSSVECGFYRSSNH
jgi:hypothetical protein